MADDNGTKPAGGSKFKLPPALEKHKGLLAAGLVGVLLLIYFMSRSSSAGAATTTTGITPDTTTADSPLTDPDLASMLSGMSGTPGLTGPAGATGATGATGTTKFSFWQEAKAKLIAGGNKNPTQGQIDRERKKIIAGVPGPSAPKKKAAVQAMPASHVTPKAATARKPAAAGKHA